MKVFQLEILSTRTGYVLGRKKTSARMQVTRLLICLFIGFNQCFGRKHNPDENAGVVDKNLFEGDIILNSQQRKAIKLGRDLDGGLFTRGATAYSSRLWPNGVVPYMIDGKISTATRDVILNAMRTWSETTCIKFKPRTSGETDYVEFFKGNGCWSHIGRQGGKQDISIGSRCDTVGTVSHEIAHALGFWHEQSRPDRDTYVSIYLKNVKPGEEGNFYKYNTRINSLGVPYDYGSVMHYGAYSFSKNNKPTIVAKSSWATIGQRIAPSGLDCKQMNLLYKCSCRPTTTSNKCCAIPFEYRGRWYHSCTSTNHHRAWCSLDRVYKGSWENCETSCCKVQTTSKQCCAIPFKYRGWWYYSCTTAYHHRAWCSLDPVYKGSWGNCPDTGCKEQTTSQQCCAIPFKYRGWWYYSCTTARHHRAWCSLDRVYNGRWGNCRATGCKEQTTSSKCCAIPFQYRGKWHYSCTKANHHRAWCSLDRVYNGRWENCQ